MFARTYAVEYIWIDALRIIQDSKEDWGKESLLMEKVYSNALCNIAATAAPDGQTGCFLQINPETSMIVTITKSAGIVRGLQTGISNLLSWFYAPQRDPVGRPSQLPSEDTYILHPEDLWKQEITSSVLLDRAWVFQERFLARRIMHFTSSQICFECRESRRAQIYIPDEHEPSDIIKQRVNSIMNEVQDPDGSEDDYMFSMLH